MTKLPAGTFTIGEGNRGVAGAIEVRGAALALATADVAPEVGGTVADGSAVNEATRRAAADCVG